MSECEYVIEHVSPFVNVVLVVVGVRSLWYLNFVASRVNYLHKHVRQPIS